MKKLTEYIEESVDHQYKYDAKNFDPKDFITWLIKMKLMNKYNRFDALEWASGAQEEAEKVGISVGDAMKVYDEAMKRLGR